MARRPGPSLLALAAIAIVTAAALVAVVSFVGRDKESHTATTAIPSGADEAGGDVRTTLDVLAGDGIDASTLLEPRILLFGDTIEAVVDVVLDRRRIDPDAVHVATSFLPWQIVNRPAPVRLDAGSTARIRTTYRLRCLTDLCLSPGQALQIKFPPARVTFTRVATKERQAVTRSRRVPWPLFTVYSRFATSSFEGRTALATPWHADLVTLPALTERARTGVIVTLLLATGLLFAVLGGGFVYLARLRRAVAPPPEPVAPQPPPLSPLEQALALLEDAARANGAEDRRRSLELVAEALEESGDADIARAARNLAWSESAPLVEETSGLATRVRETLWERLMEAEAGNDEAGDERVG